MPQAWEFGWYFKVCDVVFQLDHKHHFLSNFRNQPRKFVLLRNLLPCASKLNELRKPMHALDSPLSGSQDISCKSEVHFLQFELMVVILILVALDAE